MINLELNDTKKMNLSVACDHDCCFFVLEKKKSTCLCDVEYRLVD